MFPLNIFLNNKYEKGDLELLKVPLGVDPYKFEISIDSNYDTDLFKMNTIIHNKIQTSKGMFCYYCGESASNIIPAFLHNGSGINLWIHTDWRCHTVLCDSCSSYSKKNNVSDEELLGALASINNLYTSNQIKELSVLSKTVFDKDKRKIFSVIDVLLFFKFFMFEITIVLYKCT